MRILSTILFMLVAGLMQSCMHGMQTASSRPTGIEKVGALPASQKPPELFVRNKTIDVEPVAKVNETGSLYNTEDQRNYLFLNKAPLSVGQYIVVNVASSRAEDPKPADKNAKADDATVSDDAVVKELLAAIPSLDPGDNSIKLQTKLKMKVDHVFENGDALVTLKRTSSAEGQGGQIDISARLPYANLVAADRVTTNDLYDVHWLESDGSQVTDRFSSAWEDEYSLRLSGFNEAKSKYAMELDDKRKQLEATRDRMRNQLISMGKERKTMATEREKLSKAKAESEQKAEELEKKVEEQESVIESQKGQISDLSPKEGDADDGEDAAKLAANGPAKKPAAKPAVAKPSANKPGDKKDGAKGK